MKLKKLAVILLSAIGAALLIGALCACGGVESLEDVINKHDGEVKVVFELEGGKYRNCEGQITYFYGYDEGTQNRIYDPQELFGEEVTRANYKFGGWYRNQSTGGEPEGKWDFENDKVGASGVTLYAYWQPLKNYSYNVCYYDEDGVLQILGTYDDLSIGDDFLDYLDFAKERTGYTFLGQYYQDKEDENGNLIPWDFSYGHPGGEEDTAINVICQYVKGDYKLVSTAEDLVRYANENVYLLNDIDLGGADFRGFGDYKKEFAGNGHTISNFKLVYGTGPINNNVIRDDLKKADFLDEEGNLLCISLFDNAQDASVKDVTFKNITITIDTSLELIKAIYVAPFATSIQNSTVSGVTVENVTITCVKLPSGDTYPNGFPQEKFHVTTEACFKADADADVTLNNIVNNTDEYFEQ